MMVAEADILTTTPPTHEEAEQARRAGRQLSEMVGRDRSLILKAVSRQSGQTLELPAKVVKLLLQLLGEMAAGHAVMLVPSHAMLTTQQAADYLGVSRPFLVKLLDEGKLPHHKVGTHRRVRFHDLIAYKECIMKARHETLDELAVQTQELGLDE